MKNIKELVRIHVFIENDGVSSFKQLPPVIKKYFYRKR